MYNKNKMGKSRKRAKFSSRLADARKMNKTGFQKSDNHVAYSQFDENHGVSAEGNKAKPAISLFRNPLFFKKAWGHIRVDIKKEKISWLRAMVRVFGCACILADPIILSLSSVVGLLREDKVDIIHVFMNAALLANGTYNLKRYLDDIKVLFSSIFDIADKSLVGFLANLLLKKLIYKGFQIGGLSYRFKNGGKGFRTFLFDIRSFVLHLAGNFALILGREKRTKTR